ncbi:MAG: UvrD-helicase domain-containing protein [Parachlamydiaceae bacterium]|nr:UvrD-helicase domain-containing protein [Parachlamydiaceae bacterium]
MKKNHFVLNASQKKAIEHVHGRVLILAGAGSGKTGVLTLRMAHLIENLGISPKSILGLTFTNKAAKEMRERLSSLVSPQAAKQVTLSTFHSFCMQILRQDISHLGYTSQFSLYDEQDVQRLINLIARDILQHEGELPSLAPTLALIQDAKNRGVTPQKLSLGTETWHDQFTQDVYIRLKASMRAYNAVDFDHLLSLSVELFESFPQVLERYQDRYQYIMIDEYQDTNPIQYRLASLLSAKHRHLCVVGDDDQSIYGWRGADIKNILNFDDAEVIKLEQNYRSTNVILRAANAVIQQNQNRHAKILWSEKGDGDLIEVFHAPNEQEEALAVIKRMIRCKEKNNLKWNEIAILYRSNALSRQFEQALLKQTWKNGDKWIQGIPYEVHGGLEFYERKEIKDLCAYLRIIVNPLDQEALLRIINQPRRGIGEDSLDLLTAYNRSNQKSLWDVLNQAISPKNLTDHIDLPSKCRKGIESFINVIQEAKKKFNQDSLSETLAWLVKEIDYQKAIDDEVKSVQMRQFKAENVQELINSLSDFEKEEFTSDEVRADRSLSAFVSQLTLHHQMVQTKNKQKQGDCLQLMTFHSSKGLEFPACFLVGLEDHIIPHEKSMKETGVEEERRLMYVAITRAKQFLTLSMSKIRNRMGKESVSQPSRFLYEIPKELLNVTDWRCI